MRPTVAGNHMLTWLLRHLTGAPITDGQSGYRALSSEAATRARIIHDYNNAQVLTLNLLWQGFRYTEGPHQLRVPSPRSVVRPARPYVRRVARGVWRALQQPATMPDAGDRCAVAIPAQLAVDVVGGTATHHGLR